MKPGISQRRFNAFVVVALRSFFAWSIKEGRTYENPAAHVPKLNERTDRRHERRALEAAEVRSLLTAAENGGELGGMSGTERALVYRTAVETGLRLNELATLTRGCVDLDAGTITVRAGYSKHRREDVQPIRMELVEALRAHVATKAPATRLFNIPASAGTCAGISS